MAEKNQKRNDILTSARVLFKENGFHNTKMDDIAQSAGVGKGTLYEYFKNKQEIFDETCVEYVTTMREFMEEIRNMDIAFKDKIMLMFREGQKSVNEDFEKNPIDYIMSYKNIISEKVLKTMFSHVTEMNKVIIEIIDQGKDEGMVRKEIPSDLIACLIVGTMGEYFNLLAYKKDYVIEEDVIFNLLFNGMGMT
ncbi:MAG: TetR/AcrR family transcriptional regulator [Sedimentibacter sp.]